MGKKFEELSTLREVKDFAKKIDEAVYWAMCKVISDRLPVKELGKSWVFPFDILLIGGDDIVLVTPAAQAMPVAYALAELFYMLTNEEQRQDSKEQAETHSLSVSVVLAPTNYPFSLMLNLVEDTLKFAKKDGSKVVEKEKSAYGKTRINFLVVSGNTSQSFSKVYKLLHQKDEKSQHSFYATMRPYTLERLKFLLEMLQEGSRLALGRTNYIGYARRSCNLIFQHR
jgi:CRISPR/Cas system-associated protein Cas10 (large subunit of type III CRISPR-Cas system)